MTHHSASWVCEEMSSVSDIWALFMCLRGEVGRRERGGHGARRRGEEKWGWRRMISAQYKRERIMGGGQGGDRWCIAGILAKPICIVSRSVGDNVSFPLCQIFTAHLSVSLSSVTKPWMENKRWEETRGKEEDGSDPPSSDSSGKITANNRKKEGGGGEMLYWVLRKKKKQCAKNK